VKRWLLRGWVGFSLLLAGGLGLLWIASYVRPRGAALPMGNQSALVVVVRGGVADLNWFETQGPNYCWRVEEGGRVALYASNTCEPKPIGTPIFWSFRMPVQPPTPWAWWARCAAMLVAFGGPGRITSLQGASSPVSSWYVFFTHLWLPTVLLLIAPSVALVRGPWRRRRRHRRGHCLRCGYDLTGLAEPRCPECGRAFEWKGAAA
jgi:hypothetical protein